TRAVAGLIRGVGNEVGAFLAILCADVDHQARFRSGQLHAIGAQVAGHRGVEDLLGRLAGLDQRNLQVVQLVRGDAAGGPDVPRDAGRIGAVDDRTAHDVAGAVVNDVQGAPESSDREVVVVDGRQRGLTVLTVNVERPVL